MALTLTSTVALTLTSTVALTLTLTIQANRFYMSDTRDIKVDPCDNRIIRCNNCPSGYPNLTPYPLPLYPLPLTPHPHPKTRRAGTTGSAGW